ncbi:hypothetical protein [Crateriforma conspicua]|nr:hypothetical protein [Crateriforma conspicua]
MFKKPGGVLVYDLGFASRAVLEEPLHEHPELACHRDRPPPR